MSPKSNKNLKEILQLLSDKDKVLILCCYELYDGQWEDLLADLKARLEGKPYVLRLGERISEDIERVKKLVEIEKRYRVKLGEMIKWF